GSSTDLPPAFNTTWSDTDCTPRFVRSTGPAGPAPAARTGCRIATIIAYATPGPGARPGPAGARPDRPRTREAAPPRGPGAKKPAPGGLLVHTVSSMVAGEGIEPPTRGFSIPSSSVFRLPGESAFNRNRLIYQVSLVHQ